MKRIALAALPLLFAMAPLRAEVSPAYLRCEYKVSPLGIDAKQPRLSWIVQSKTRGEKQTAYQILVSSAEKKLQGDLWDSGKVLGNATNAIAYAGKPLQSGQSVWWQVRAWDKNGKPSKYSAPAQWTMALLNAAQEWKGQWINLEKLPGQKEETVSLKDARWMWFPEGNNAENVPAATRFFRLMVAVPADIGITAAKLYLTADDMWTVWVNGQELGKSGSDEFEWRKLRAFDVQKLLKAGPNVIAIEAKNAKDGPAGVLAKLVIESPQWGTKTFVSDGNWKSSQSAGANWQSAAFDDATWQVAKTDVAYGSGPWLDQVGSSGNKSVPPAAFLRRDFQVKKPLRRATAYATALGLYELHLNGKRVGNDVFSPGWTDYKKRTYYQTYDVTNLMKQGANAVGAILGDGWATGHVGNGGRDRYGIHRPRFNGQINLEYADGTREIIASDGSWKAAYGPIIEQDLLDGEFYDATREMLGWSAPNFNDATWQKADSGTPEGAPDGKAWPAKMEAYPGVAVRKLKELSPQTVTEPKPGNYVFDLRQNMVGWVRLNNITAPRGTKIRLRFAEMLNPDGTIYTTNLRGARATDEYTCKGGAPENWEPRFTFHGFRYVELTGLTKPDTGTITGVVTYSDTPFVGTFECSNPMVNQLQSNIQWGQRGNFLEVPTDCPQRDERLGWMGDAQIFVKTATYNADVAAFFEKWMVDVEDAMRGDAFPDVAPDVCCGAGTPAWADAGLIVPWTIYQAYGDKQILQKHYGAMARYVEWVKKENPDLLMKKRGSDYGDWLSIAADTPKEILGTAYFAYSTNLLAKSARVLGKSEDAQKYEALFEQIKAAFNKAYVAEDGRIKGDTQTNYVLALRFDLLPENKREAAAKYLAEDIEKKNNHLSTGFVGVGYLNPTLTNNGAKDIAYKLLLQDTFPSWGYSIKQGATTIWERWDGYRADKGFQDPSMNSFNHYSLGSVGEWMFDTVAGIGLDPNKPGFAHIILRPQPGGGLTFARATYDSIRGKIISDWKIENGVFKISVTIPANTSATLYLPAKPNARITESGKLADKIEGVQFLKNENGAALYEIGSGHYSFEVK